MLFLCWGGGLNGGTVINGCLPRKNCDDDGGGGGAGGGSGGCCLGILFCITGAKKGRVPNAGFGGLGENDVGITGAGCSNTDWGMAGDHTISVDETLCTGRDERSFHRVLCLFAALIFICKLRSFILCSYAVGRFLGGTLASSTSIRTGGFRKIHKTYKVYYHFLIKYITVCKK